MIQIKINNKKHSNIINCKQRRTHTTRVSGGGGLKALKKCWTNAGHANSILHQLLCKFNTVQPRNRPNGYAALNLVTLYFFDGICVGVQPEKAKSTISIENFEFTATERSHSIQTVQAGSLSKLREIGEILTFHFIGAHSYFVESRTPFGLAESKLSGAVDTHRA